MAAATTYPLGRFLQQLSSRGTYHIPGADPCTLEHHSALVYFVGKLFIGDELEFGCAMWLETQELGVSVPLTCSGPRKITTQTHHRSAKLPASRKQGHFCIFVGRGKGLLVGTEEGRGQVVGGGRGGGLFPSDLTPLYRHGPSPFLHLHQSVILKPFVPHGRQAPCCQNSRCVLLAVG